jgi:glycosyltransferase involved in cell wall biosynthesis
MVRPIRVLELIKGFNIESGGGGAERFAIELAQALDKSRFETSICSLWDFSTQDERDRRSLLLTAGIPSFSLARWDDQHPYLGMWHAYHGLINALRRQPVDIVNTHSEFADIAVLPLWLSRNRPKLIRTMHYSHQVEWIQRPLRRYVFSDFLIPMFFDLEIGVSQSLVDRLDQRPIARLKGKRASRVYNAVNLDRFANSSLDLSKKRASLGIPAGTFVVGTIGRLTEQKGYTYLIDAAALVLEKKPQAFFLIVGDGELTDQLKQLALQKGISTHINFTGGRQDVEELLACMDLFVISSLWEGLPTVVLESMAAGIPIVATDIPGIRELIQDQRNGWLVPAENIKSLADAIEIAQNDAKSRAEFAEIARQDVQSLSIKSIAADYDKLYSALI